MGEQKIARRVLGRTGLSVTELSFGAMNLRQLNTYEEAEKILKFVLDQGINLIDTARSYNGESPTGLFVESEVLVGKAIRQYKGLKEPIVVITKGHGYELDALEEELSTSISKLGVEGKGNLYIGENEVKLVYFFHGINTERWDTMCKSGVLDRVKQLKEQGVINYIGFSSHYAFAKEIKEAIDTEIFDVVELPYNVFNRSLGEDGAVDLLQYIHEKNIGIINMKAFNGNGMPPLYNTLKEYISIDYEKMLNFCLSNPYITTVDAGAKYIQEFQKDIETVLDKRLNQEELMDLKKEADKVSYLMKDICRECMHCLEKFECVKGINFPGILATYSRYKVCNNLGKETEHFKEQYGQFELNGEDCIECGKCMPWCEYKLEIPTMMKEAHKIFGSK